MGTNLHELVNAGQAANRHPLSQMHMPAQCGVVGQRGMVIDLTVVGHMGVGHDPVVIADFRQAQITGRSDVERAKLANRIAVSNAQSTGFAPVLLVLRNGAQGIKLKDPVVTPDSGVPLQHAMRSDHRTGANLDVRTNQCISAHTDRLVKLGARIYDGSCMNRRHAKPLT